MNNQEEHVRTRADDDHAHHQANGDTAGLEENIERHRANIDQTLSELESKFSPGEIIEQTLRQMGGGTGDFLHSFKNTATSNPVPMALMGVGLAWMMFGGQSDQQARATTSEQESTSDPDLPDVSDFRDIYMFYLQQEHPFDQDQLECILYEDMGPDSLIGYAPHSSLRSSGGDWVERWGGTHETARDEALSRIYKTRSRMTEGSAETKERLERARTEAWRHARRAQATVDRKAREAKRRVSDMVDRYPLSLVALGVAAGAAVGGSLPNTQSEDQLMGEASDHLKAQGKAKVQEQAEQVKETATAVGSAAKEEAQAQGLDPRQLGDKAGHVAQAAHEEQQRQTH